jgi:hypothetical protein
MGWCRQIRGIVTVWTPFYAIGGASNAINP